MQTFEHCKTQTFSLIGRRISLLKPYSGCTDGMIVEKIGPARFGCYLQQPDSHFLRMSGEAGRPTTVDFHRAEFALLPRLRAERMPVYLPADSDGFAYADEPNF